MKQILKKIKERINRERISATKIKRAKINEEKTNVAVNVAREKNGKNFNHIKQTAAKLITACSVASFSLVSNVAAMDAVTRPIDTIKTLVTSIVTGIGAIVLIWGIFDFASAYQQHDSSQQTMAVKKLVAGFIMAAAPQVVALLI